jgi:phage terminase large subunit-like protein
MGYSPDRVDALVWALTELMIEGEGGRRLLIG